MKQLVSVLVLFASLGCMADNSNDPGIASAFDNVSLELFHTMSSKASEHSKHQTL